jgi:16S rRNA (uracil1498-N3)-methyltransferase
MRRFTIAPERIEGDRVAFDRDETRHLARVLRLGPGDLVVAADGGGRDYTVRIERLGETAAGRIVAVAAGRAESPLAVTLVQGIPKGDKMELIVRAATELGAVRICPGLAARTVVTLDAARWRERARRWQRVAREATKQCGRAVVPEVDVPRPLGDCVAAADPRTLRLCLWEGEAAPLATLLADLPGPPPTAWIAVGPEGGLTRDEVDRARGHGWLVAGLGPRILRTETAGPALIAVLQARWGDLGRR